MHQSPFDIILPSVALAPVELGDGAVVGASSFMRGWDGIVFMLVTGAIDSGGGQTLKAQQSSDDGDADDFTDIAGAVCTAIADDEDGSAALLDVWRPTKNYVRPVVTAAGTGVAQIGSLLAFRYRRTGRGPNVFPADSATILELKKVVGVME